MLGDLLVLPALDPVDDDHTLPNREGHHEQRLRDRLRSARLPLQAFDAGRIPFAVSQRVQTGAPLGHCTMVVAVNQIRRPQYCHPAGV